MKWYRIKAVILRHWYELRHNFNRLTDVFYWPILDVVVWGFFTMYITRTNSVSSDFVGAFMGAVILWGLFYGFQRNFAVSFLDELWVRNLINLFVSPLSINEYLTANLIISIVKIFLSFLAMTVLAMIFYAFNIFPFILPLLPFLLILVLFALSVGILISGLILRYTTKIEILAWSFAGLLQPVSCVFYSLTTLPRVLRYVAWFLPTTHAFEGMRAVLVGHAVPLENLWWGLGLNAVYLIAVLIYFRNLFASIQKKGLLVKME